MSCPRDELLVGLLENRLDEAARATLERHVAECPDCSDVVAVASDWSEDATPTLTTAPTPMEAPTRSAVRPPRATRRRRPWGSYAFAATALLGFATALGYVGAGFLLDRVPRAVARLAAARIGRPVAIGAMAVAVPRSLDALVVHLSDVRIGGNPANADAAPAVDLVLALPALLRGDLEISRIRVTQPVLYFGEAGRPRTAGRQPSAVGPGDSEASLAALAMLPLEIVDGVLVAGFADGSRLTLTAAQILTTPTPAGAHLVASGLLGDGTVTATGVVGAGNALALTIEARDVPLAIVPQTRGRLTGTADVHLAIGGTAATPHVKGHARVRNGRASGWNPLPPLLAPSAPLGPELIGAGDLTFDELRTSFAVRGYNVRLPRLVVTRPGISVEAALRVTATRAVRGTGTAHLSGTLATAVAAAAPSLAAQQAPDGRLALPFSVAGSADAPSYTLR
jgi:hypothetical protein